MVPASTNYGLTHIFDSFLAVKGSSLLFIVPESRVSALIFVKFLAYLVNDVVELQKL